MCSDSEYLYLYQHEQVLQKVCISDSVPGIAKGHVVKESKSLQELPTGHLFMVQDILYFRCKGVFMHQVNK